MNADRADEDESMAQLEMKSSRADMEIEPSNCDKHH